jgi:uncharacterized protein YqeY
MGLKNQLGLALNAAMKENSPVKKNVIRVLLSNIKLLEVEKGSELDDAAIISLIQKDIKQHRETIEAAEKGARLDIIEQSKNEIKVLETFLPAQLPEAEIRSLILECVKETNAASISDTGKVMKILMPKIAGRSSGAAVNKLVNEILSK